MEQEKIDWEKYGILDDIDEDRKDALSKLFDRAYNESLSVRADDKSDEFTVLVFPAIRRVYSKLNNVDNFNLDDLIMYIQKESTEEKVKIFMKDKVFTNNIDWEAEYLDIITKPYIDKLNNEN